MCRLGLTLVFLVCAFAAQAQNSTFTLATVNGSVTIAVGNTFQSILAAVPINSQGRRSLTIENNNTADSCWLFIGSAAATKGASILLPPGGSYTRYAPYIPSDLLQGTCATANDTLYIDTQ